jgi:hypothetical protein
MSLFDHKTIGDVQKYVYLEGTIKKIYLEDDDIAEALWDTADVEYENKKMFYNAPVRYHCQATGIERTNGAVADGGRGFDVGDKVILMAKIGSAPGKGEEYEKVYVVAHRDGPVPCTYNFLFIRISATALLPHAPPYGDWIRVENNLTYVARTPESHAAEYCTVWDAKKGAPANVYNPVTKLPYVFPVTVEDFKPALDIFRFCDEELFTLDSQGDEQSQEAGFIPDWKSDFQGELIRAGANPNTWWTTYSISGNPVLSLLIDTELALATDGAGAADGTFKLSMAKFDAARVENGLISKWKEASPLAFNEDIRSFDVKGSDATREMPLSVQERLQELQKLIGEQTDLIGKITIVYSIADTAKIERWKILGAIPERTPAEQSEYVGLNTSQLILKYNAYGSAGSSASSMISRWEALYARLPLTDQVEQAEFVAITFDAAIVLYLKYKAIRVAAQLEVDIILAKNEFVAWEIAHDKDMKTLKGSSYHMQFAYGEDEIWLCAKNVYAGMVVNACDAMWKFGRVSTLPPVIEIGNPAAERLMGQADLASAGLTRQSIISLSDIALFLAADITQADDANIFSYGTLKRINDGGFHRTTHPALKTQGIGSWRMTQAKIPREEKEPTVITALNTRSEAIDVWHRYDNWMNSIPYSYATWGVDRTSWFKSEAMQWKIKADFIDTPIGSMWHAAPAWEAALWYLSGLSFSTGAITARKDVPINTQFIRQTKHSRRVIAQIYIVQRQGLSMFEDPARTFMKQELNKGIYDHFTPVIPPEVQIELDALQAIVTDMTAQIKKIDAEKIARWDVLNLKLPVTNPTLLAELEELEKDPAIISYRSFKDLKNTTQASIDAILHPLEIIKYVAAHIEGQPDDGIKNDDYYTLTAEQKKSLISDRVYVRTKYPGEVDYVPPAALRANRNEVEIMASCDLYSALKTQKADGTQPVAGEEISGGTCNPTKQVRRGLLEYEIQKLFALYYSGSGLGVKDFSAVQFEARII